ncbi:MAG: 2-C-methyl-D-erythritol 2,4-cyclodiphosphate synthase [Chloroflexi bacterium]|nr:2-C-methyl-D-erythritol 2,4-cyclodiphosphate synthase [Chloroflexota bacterium]
MNQRIGIGFDSHRFAAARPFILGGVRISESDGLQGHSDADALTHAIIDALLGAAALGDIGVHFPPSDGRWADADSQDLLTRTVDLLARHGFRVGNVDATVVAERPRLAPHIAAMRAQLARTLQVTEEAVSVKATRPEGLGALGRGEGVAVQAVAQIVPGHDC